MMAPESPLKSNKSSKSAAVEDAVVTVRLPDHAVAEPVGGGRELDRHVGDLLEAVELPAVVEDLRDDPLLGQPLDPVVEHDPLVVPGRNPPRLGEDVRRRVGPARQHVADRIVELEHREMGLGDEQVLVVPVVADQGEALRANAPGRSGNCR